MALPSQEALPLPSSSKQPVKAKTAYFLFSEEHREAARAHLLSEKEEGAKVSVADVAKELGRRWKLLSDAEKGEFKTRCLEAAAARAATAHDATEGEEPGEAADAGSKAEAGSAASSTKPQGLPLSLVKRIACLDEEVSRVSQEGIVVVARAAEMFLELLAERCAKALVSSKPKRSTIKLQDLGEVVKRDRRMVSAGLKDVISLAEQEAAKTAEARADKAAAAAEETAKQDAAAAGGEGQAAAAAVPGKVSKKRKAEMAVASTKPITAFFAKPAAS